MSALVLPLATVERVTHFKLGHQPALDGLRAFSILAVLILHANLIIELPATLLPGGFLGVDVFFVISGFLITSLLVEEYSATSAVSLRRFYIRRALRLLPALFLAILIVGAIALFVEPSLLGLTPLRSASLLYFTNWVRAYEPSRLWIFSHFWSLAIEEQFYVVWPLVLVVLLRSRLRPQTIIGIVIGLALLSASLRSVMYAGAVPINRLYHGSDTRADALLIGCALSLILHWIPDAFQNEQAIRKAGRAGVIVLVAMVLIVTDGFPLLYFGGFTLAALAAAAIILRVVQVEPPKTLTRPVALWIGRRSYGLYIWHWPAFYLTRLALGKGWLTVAIGVALTFIVAGLSYRFIELPFLRRKARYA